jgi:hypothetical protein
MRRFLIKSISFSGALLLLLIILFWLSMELNRRLYRNVTIDPKISTLVIGDSHTELAINDSLLPNTLNISTPAEGYVFTYFKIRQIIEHNSNVKNIMLGVSYHNFSSFYDKYIFEEEPYSLISQYLSLMDYRYLFMFLKKSASIANISAIFRNSIGNLTGYEKNKYPYIGGFHIIENDDDLTVERITKRINSQYYLNDQPLPGSEINGLYLKKIVELCRGKNVNLIFLNTPLFSEYYAKVPDNMINEYKQAVKYLGVAEISFDGLDLPADCFLPDGDHLNYKGAMLTTRYLASKLAKSPISEVLNDTEATISTR